jgi:hypothetical protein
MSISFGPSHTSYGLAHDEIHTSDRLLFRRCRRKWYFASPLRLNMQKKEEEYLPFWVGTGAHVALEDYHGYNRFGSPAVAWSAYVNSFSPSVLPHGWEESYEIIKGLLQYYVDYWLPKRNVFKTFTIDGVPQVEVHFKIPIPGTDALYVGTFDRIVEDRFGRLYIQDYKFVKKYDLNKFDLDQQITSYLCAAPLYYNRPFEGLVYHQFIKAPLAGPQRLAVRGGFSKSKSNPTTYGLYRAALLAEYGGIPADYVDHLRWLGGLESTAGDMYIRMDIVKRSAKQLEVERKKMIAETKDMTNPKLPLYPNPTPGCNYECAFKNVCIGMDSGLDWKSMLRSGFERRPEFRIWQKKFGEYAQAAMNAKANGQTFEIGPPKAFYEPKNELVIDFDGDDEGPPWNQPTQRTLITR